MCKQVHFLLFLMTTIISFNIFLLGCLTPEQQNQQAPEPPFVINPEPILNTTPIRIFCGRIEGFTSIPDGRVGRCETKDKEMTWSEAKPSIFYSTNSPGCAIRMDDRRHLASSTDGGETSSEMKAHPDLEVTQFNGSMITLRDEKGRLTSNLLFSIPSPGGRKDGLIYVSQDHGKSWSLKHQPVKGFFAYSALIRADPNTVILFFESNRSEDIRLMRIPVSTLLSG